MSLRNGLVVLCVLILFSSTSLFSQATSGAVFGTVTDPTGAVVAGAKVTITDVSKGITVTTTTNESGNYAQTHLTVGTYKITVEATGFKTSVQENIPISVDANARVDLTLQVGDVTQEVTVSETPPLLKSDRADVSDTLSARGAFSGNALRERPRACAPPSLSSRPSYAATGKGRS